MVAVISSHPVSGPQGCMICIGGSGLSDSTRDLWIYWFTWRKLHKDFIHWGFKVTKRLIPRTIGSFRLVISHVRVADKWYKVFMTIYFTAVGCGLPRAMSSGPSCTTQTTPRNGQLRMLCPAPHPYDYVPESGRVQVSFTKSLNDWSRSSARSYFT